MKKKLLAILIITISFLFIQSIEAKVCKYKTLKYYWKGNSKTTYNECSDRNATSSFTLPTSNNASSTPTLSVKYNAWKNSAGDPLSKSFGSVEIRNWNQDIHGAEKAGSVATLGQECPKNMLVRVGVNGSASNGQAKAYAVSSQSIAESVLNYVVKNNVYGNQSFFFIQEYVPEEEEKTPEKETYKSCRSFESAQGTPEKKYLDGCLTNEQYSCVWVRKKVKGIDKPVEYCNFDSLTYVGCGRAWDLPDKLPGIISFIVNLAKIATPIILVLVSIISLVKAVASSKEEDIKKAQNTLIRRLIAAAIVFFVIQMTQFVMLKVADSAEGTSIKSCLNCFLNNSCGPNRYYKTMEGGRYICTNLDGSKFTGICH